MKNFFKPEDFDKPSAGYLSPDDYAAIANAKLLSEGKVVYGAPGEILSFMQLYPHTYKALLINIEPIESCKHPIEKIKANDPNVIHGFICICGVKVRPTSFEVVE